MCTLVRNVEGAHYNVSTDRKNIKRAKNTAAVKKQCNWRCRNNCCKYLHSVYILYEWSSSHHFTSDGKS